MEFWLGLHKINAFRSTDQETISPNTTLQRKMISYIRNSYMNKISLQNIAEAAHVSISKCCRIFKQYMGYSPMEYTNIYRMKMGAQMLIYTDLSIMEIGMKCGIEYPSHSTALFSKYFHCTPKEYRKKYNVTEDKLYQMGDMSHLL